MDSEFSCIKYVFSEETNLQISLQNILFSDSLLYIYIISNINIIIFILIILVYMEKYFYKGIPINYLISDGNDGSGNILQTTTIGNFINVPKNVIDGNTIAQLGSVGYTNNGQDIGLNYTSFYETVSSSKQINLQPYYASYFDTISAILVGGTGGGGGGGGSGFENVAPSGTNFGWSGNGGGGGGLSIYNKSSITGYNQLDITVGGGGTGGTGGAKSNNDAGQAGGRGGDGGSSSISGQTGANSTVLSTANGGGGGYGGAGAGASSSAGGPNASQGAGGTGTTASGSIGNKAQTTNRTISGTAGVIGSQTTCPAITSGGGGVGGTALNTSAAGNAGTNGSAGCVRIYFFKS